MTKDGTQTGQQLGQHHLGKYPCRKTNSNKSL